MWEKRVQGIPRGRVPEVEINDQIYKPTKKRSSLISEIRSLSADCLPSRIKARVYGVSVIQLFGVRHFEPHFVCKLDGCIVQPFFYAVESFRFKLRKSLNYLY